MSSKKKKPASGEARERLEAKLVDVKNKVHSLHETINKVSSEAIKNAELVLEEKSKSKFRQKYAKTSQDLEVCLSQLILMSDALLSLNDESSSEVSGSDEEEESKDDEDKSCFTATDCQSSASTDISTLARPLSELSVTEVESVTTIIVSSDVDDTTVTFQVERTAKEDTTTDSVAHENELRRRSHHGSQESMFSSVSTSHKLDPESYNELMQNTNISSDFKIEAYNWQSDVAYGVILTKVISPWEFNIQIINEDNDRLIEQLCMEFMKEAANGYKGGLSKMPPAGVYCCARSPIDEQWYRVKIIKVIDESTAVVFLVDEGLEVEVGRTSLRPLSEKYTKVPKQSFECILGGVQPSAAVHDNRNLSFEECRSMWSEASETWMREFANSSSIFIAYLYYPPSQSYQPPHNIKRETVICDLYLNQAEGEIDWGELSISRPPISDHLAFNLVTKGFASPCPYFESALNRKKSQRLLKEYMQAQKAEASASLSGINFDEIPPHNKRDVKSKADQITQTIKNEITLNDPLLTSSPNRDTSHHQVNPSDAHSNNHSPQTDTSDPVRMTKDRALPLNDAKSVELKKDQNTKYLNTNPSHKEKTENERELKISQLELSQPINSSSSVASNSPQSKKKRSRRSRSRSSSQKNKAENVTSPVRSESNSARDSSTNSENSLDPSNSETFKPHSNNASERFQGHQSELLSTTPRYLDEFVGNTLIPSPTPKAYKFGVKFKEKEFVTQTEEFAKIVVSEVVSPGLFYIQLITPEAELLDLLMDELNQFYEDECEQMAQFCERFSYEEGMPIVARYSGDLKWYRATIATKIAVSDGEFDYDVLYVDYGSSERLSQKEILPLCEQFCELSKDVIPCCLADVFPVSSSVSQLVSLPSELPGGGEIGREDDAMIIDSPNETLHWSGRAIKRFKELLFTQQPLLAAAKSNCKNVDGVLELYLYDTTDEKDIFINQLLVNEGLVISPVFCKKAPTVTVYEADLEQEVQQQSSMSDWDPMKEQFHSDRNKYSVNIDDPEVAMLGYVAPKKALCCNFQRRGHCYRGEDCRFLHANPNDPLLNAVEVFCDNVVVELPNVGDWVAIAVTALYDPTHIWVNFPYGIDLFKGDQDTSSKFPINKERTLEHLSKLMNEYYSKSGRDESADLTLLAEGELVAAKYEEDSCWYRARVTNTADELVQVFYVDYGNTEVLEEKNIRKLTPEFMHLPHQAVECFLYGITLSKEMLEDPNEYEESRLRFRDLTADKVLVANVKSKTYSKELYIDLYDTSTTPDTNIIEELKLWKGIKSTSIKEGREKDDKTAASTMMPT